MLQHLVHVFLVRRRIGIDVADTPAISTAEFPTPCPLSPPPLKSSQAPQTCEPVFDRPVWFGLPLLRDHSSPTTTPFHHCASSLPLVRPCGSILQLLRRPAAKRSRATHSSSVGCSNVTTPSLRSPWQNQSTWIGPSPGPRETCVSLLPQLFTAIRPARTAPRCPAIYRQRWSSLQRKGTGLAIKKVSHFLQPKSGNNNHMLFEASSRCY